MQPSLVFQGAYSVGQSQRSQWWKSHTEQNPAPSLYNLPNFYDKPKQPKHQIGTGNRTTLGNIIDIRGYPEVGKYKLKPSIGQAQNKIKFSKASRSYTTDIPPASKMGPAQFKPNDKSAKKNLPHYSFGYRFLDAPKNEIPSPDTYPREEITEFKQKRTENSWKQKKNEKEGFNYSQERWHKSKILMPGPGDYDLTDKNMKHGPQYKFTNSEKLPQTAFNNQNFPGPGTFDPKYLSNKNNGISLSQKLGSSFEIGESDFRKTLIINFLAGPGQYQPQLVKTNQTIKFSGEKKGDLVQREDLYKPGPWKYDNQIGKKQKSFLHTDSFSMSQRQPLNKIDEFPGAGTYYPNEKTVDGVSWTMAAKLKEKKFQQASYPGPSSYDPSVEYVKQSSQMVTVKSGQRTNFVYSKFTTNGPGAYQLNSTVRDKQSSKFSIGTQERFRSSKSQYEPGPGAYEIGGTIGKIPDYLNSYKKQIEKSEEIK